MAGHPNREQKRGDMKTRLMAALGVLLVALGLGVGISSPAQAAPFTGAGFYYAGGSQTFTGTDYVQIGRAHV